MHSGHSLRVRILLGAAGHERVDRRHDEEEHRGGDRHEREHVVEEVAVGEVAAVDRERQRGEVRLAEDRGDDRRDDVGDERLDHGGERGADDDRHREVDDVAAEQELLEVGEQFWHWLRVLIRHMGRRILWPTGWRYELPYARAAAPKVWCATCGSPGRAGQRRATRARSGSRAWLIARWVDGGYLHQVSPACTRSATGRRASRPTSPPRCSTPARARCSATPPRSGGAGCSTTSRGRSR